MFHAPSSYDIARDRQFFVGEGDGFCHLTLHKSSRPSALYSFRSFARTGSAADHTLILPYVGGTVPRARAVQFLKTFFDLRARRWARLRRFIRPIIVGDRAAPVRDLAAPAYPLECSKAR